MGTTCTTPPSPNPTTLTLRPTPIIGSLSRGVVSSGAKASTARHRSPCTNIHPSDLTPTGLLTVPTSPIIPSLPVRAGRPLEARNEPRTPNSTPPISIAATTTAPSNTPEYGTPAPRSARPPASSVTMPPAVSRPWFVRLRSTIKSTIPRRIRISPIRGGNHHHQKGDVWSVDRYKDDASIVARG